MALQKRDMATVIRRNGHLLLDGTETIEDLREALFNLRKHTVRECQRIHLGIPIEILLPRVDVLVPKRMQKSVVTSVTTTRERR